MGKTIKKGMDTPEQLKSIKIREARENKKIKTELFMREQLIGRQNNAEKSIQEKQEKVSAEIKNEKDKVKPEISPSAQAQVENISRDVLVEASENTDDAFTKLKNTNEEIKQFEDNYKDVDRVVAEIFKQSQDFVKSENANNEVFEKMSSRTIEKIKEKIKFEENSIIRANKKDLELLNKKGKNLTEEEKAIKNDLIRRIRDSRLKIKQWEEEIKKLQTEPIKEVKNENEDKKTPEIYKQAEDIVNKKIEEIESGQTPDKIKNILKRKIQNDFLNFKDKAKNKSVEGLNKAINEDFDIILNRFNNTLLKGKLEEAEKMQYQNDHKELSEYIKSLNKENKTDDTASESHDYAMQEQVGELVNLEIPREAGEEFGDETGYNPGMNVYEKTVDEEAVKTSGEEKEININIEKVRADFETARRKYHELYKAHLDSTRSAGRWGKIRTMVKGRKTEVDPESELGKAKAVYEKSKKEYAMELKNNGEAGKVFEELLIGEMKKMQDLNIESYPPQEKGIFRKSLEWYVKQNMITKVLLSTVFVTGVVASVGGFGASSAFVFGGYRFARGILSAFSGMALGKSVDYSMSQRIKKEFGSKEEEIKKTIEEGDYDFDEKNREFSGLFTKKMSAERRKALFKGLAAIVGGVGVSIAALNFEAHASETGLKNNTRSHIAKDPSTGIKPAASEQIINTIKADDIKIQNAIIARGQGVEHVFKNQLIKNPVKFLYNGDLNDKAAIIKWAETRAHEIAINNDYVNSAGGIRVGTKGIGQAAYVLENKNGDIEVIEFFQDKPGGDFIKQNAGEIHEYEYEHPSEDQEFSNVHEDKIDTPSDSSEEAPDDSYPITDKPLSEEPTPDTIEQSKVEINETNGVIENEKNPKFEAKENIVNEPSHNEGKEYVKPQTPVVIDAENIQSPDKSAPPINPDDLNSKQPLNNELPKNNIGKGFAEIADKQEIVPGVKIANINPGNIKNIEAIITTSEGKIEFKNLLLSIANNGQINDGLNSAIDKYLDNPNKAIKEILGNKIDDISPTNRHSIYLKGLIDSVVSGEESTKLKAFRIKK